MRRAHSIAFGKFNRLFQASSIYVDLWVDGAVRAPGKQHASEHQQFSD